MNEAAHAADTPWLVGRSAPALVVRPGAPEAGAVRAGPPSRSVQA